jgi:hypothetical protein
MHGPHDHKHPTLLGALVAVACVVCAADCWAQNRGDCVTSNVPESFTLPDGSVHAAGRLTLCTVQAFTPAVGLHRAWTDGEGASFVMSRVAQAEATADSRPVLLFRRAPGSRLEFVGYVWPEFPKSWSYTLQRSGPAGIAVSETFGAVRSLDRMVTPPPPIAN